MESNVFLSLSAFLSGITNLLLIGFVLFKIKDPNATKIILYGLILALWNFASLGIYFSLSSQWALIWLKFYYINVVFIPSVFFHLVLTTIGDHRLITKRICQVNYGFSYLFLILSAMGMMTQDVNYVKGCYYPVGQVGDFLFFIFFSGTGIYSLLVLANRRRTTSNIIEKKQLRLLFVGGYINLVGIGSNLFCFISGKMYAAGHLLTGIYPLIIVYTIVRHRLVTIETQNIEILGRKFIYFGLSGFIFALFLGGILWFELAFRKLIGYNSLITSILIILTLIIFFQFIWEKMQATIDRYFFRERLNQEYMAKEISRKIASNFDREILLDTFLNSMVNMIHIRNASIILLDETKDTVQVNRAIGLDVIKKKTTRFKTDSGLIHYLIQSKKPIIREEVRNSINGQWREIKKDIEALDAAICIPLTSKDKLLGMLSLGEKMSLESYTREDIEFLSILSNEVGVAIENANLYQEKMTSFLNTIQSLLAAVEAKDIYTHGHCERVAKYSEMIATELGLSTEEIKKAKIAGFLHDLGNIGISDQILNKKERLTIPEFENVKKHTLIGAKILEPICSEKEIIDGVKFHHERIDGSGYPESLNDNSVPLIAKIITVADVYDAMTSIRPYRKAFSSEDAISELKRGCGYLFEGKVVSAFIKVLNKERIKSRK
ncbi:MAG: HD domain-containing phosphohydrolase [bacterium]